MTYPFVCDNIKDQENLYDGGPLPIILQIIQIYLKIFSFTLWTRPNWIQTHKSGEFQKLKNNVFLFRESNDRRDKFLSKQRVNLIELGAKF